MHVYIASNLNANLNHAPSKLPRSLQLLPTLTFPPQFFQFESFIHPSKRSCCRRRPVQLKSLTHITLLCSKHLPLHKLSLERSNNRPTTQGTTYRNKRSDSPFQPTPPPRWTHSSTASQNIRLPIYTQKTVLQDAGCQRAT
jgi:hypothetical protein